MTEEKEIPDFDVNDILKVEYKPVPNDDYEEQKIVFYCHDCAKLVDTESKGKKLKFVCKECQGSDLSYGTERSIRNYYNMPEAND
ncbi:MAG: hypothetical protein N4A36_00100 [Candidatus Gracilibacteria bacterium]|jgi:endogenous inhibitor of DNA gyrase (YacG/DUF329 family)|nr:hypothetical protein [Candidatus Gracilibacteria bacterium]